MSTKYYLSYLKLALSVSVLAPPLTTHAGQGQNEAHPRYNLIDLGTLGGPSSKTLDAAPVLNNRREVVGVADTLNPDPFDPICFAPNCLVQHAFRWQNGSMVDLGALPGGGSSAAYILNERGQAIGNSQNGLVNPQTGTPEFIAVLWEENGELVNLGTLGGTSSSAF